MDNNSSPLHCLWGMLGIAPQRRNWRLYLSTVLREVDRDGCALCARRDHAGKLLPATLDGTVLEYCTGVITSNDKRFAFPCHWERSGAPHRAPLGTYSSGYLSPTYPAETQWG